MAQSQRNNYALLQYYLREKLWRHANILSSDMCQAYNDDTFRLWKAFSFDMEGNGSEALREYKNCEQKREIRYPALLGLQMIYRRNNDQESIAGVEKKMGQEERNASPGAIVQAAVLLWHSGDSSRAREIVNRVLDNGPEYRDEYTSVLLVRGWIDVTSGRGTYVDKANAYFEQVLSVEAADNQTDIEGILGRVAYLEKKNQYWASGELLNKLIVSHSNFIPALLVKAKQLMKVEDWDQAAELTQRVLGKDSMNVEAIILGLLYLLVKESRIAPAVSNMNDLIKALEQREPRNAQLYFLCAQCFSRLSYGNLQLLSHTSQLIEIACQLQPHNTDYQAEIAYQNLLKGDLKAGHTIYKKASTAGDGNMVPLLGLIKCTILNGKLDDASQQIDFLNEIQTPQSKNAELLILTAMLKWRKDRDQKGSLEKLDQAVEVHRQDIAVQSPGLMLYTKLNPPLMLEMAREYIQHCRTEPASGPSIKHDPLTEKTRRVLDMLLRHVPGCTEAQLLSSKMSFVSGDIEKASTMIASCIRQDHSLSEAHLLSAQIQQYAGNLQAANQALEQALSLDFEVRDQPQYNLLRGVVLCSLGDYAEALGALEHALDLVKNPPPPAQRSTRGALKQLSVQDHVSLYLQLAQVYLKQKQGSKAKQIIAEATQAFRDTAQMGRVIIAHALMLARTNVDNALETLRTVPTKSEYFLAAKAQMAQLYLHHKQNRKAFARCYEELVEAFPSVQSYVYLGEAYVSIQEPDKAITAFEKARAMDPNDAELAVRIGRTLVTTHDYQRAKRYYRDAVASDPSKSSLRQDLAILYWRLRDTEEGAVEKAIQTIKESPIFSRPPNQDDLAIAVERVNMMLLQAKIYRSLKAEDGAQPAVEALIQARVYQNSVLTKLRGESNEVIYQQRAIAADICLELGNFYNHQYATEKALTFYNEALKQDETNDKAMLALAQLYLHTNEVDSCEHQCNALLRVQPQCEEAIMMLADLMFRRNRYEDAAYHFLQLLGKKPDNFPAMVQYVQLLRRAGHLEEAPAVFSNAEKLLKLGQRPDPGLCYARGLYQRFTNNSREALVQFNLARRPLDGPWSQPAICAMVEAYIWPDNENIWDDTSEQKSPEALENIRMAERLLGEIKDCDKRALLEGYVLIATKKRDNLERAITKFFELINAWEGTAAVISEPSISDASGKGGGGGEVGPTDRVNVPCAVAMAIILQVMKQTPKARSHLKRMAKANYNPEEDDHYERGWLLLADIYIQNGKYDLAQELLKKALQANKSCTRAWELMGLIYEKEQAYKDAADCYDSAWKLVKGADATIGFKLAFNYMKARQFVQAIDISHEVLKKHPNYPKIQKDVLERARAALRP